MIKSEYHNIMDNDIAKDIGRVGVLYGGNSDEREVSFWSGQEVYNALKYVGIDVILIDVKEDFLNIIIERPFDYAFIALHGRGGEDGTIQAILDWMKIPYTGSGVLASAIAMDKIKTKELWKANNLPVLPHVILDDCFDNDFVVDKVGLPMIIKPVFGGSSNGISKVDKIDDLEPAYKKALKYDSVIMAERWMDGDEFTGAIIGSEALPLIKIKAKNGLYDFNEKYVTGAEEYKCPCGLSDEKEKSLQDIMLRSANAIGVTDWCRVDFMLDNDDNPWLIEINTIPGMTKKSLVPKASNSIGLTFEETVLKVLKISWDNNCA